MTPIIFKFFPYNGYIERCRHAKKNFRMLLFGGFLEGFSFANKADNLNFSAIKKVEFDQIIVIKCVKNVLILSFE